MAQMLVANGFALHYFDAKKYGELDFVIQRGSSIDLIEVKSGADYKKHAALDRIMNVENWKTTQAIVFCRDNVQISDDVLYLPWYMAVFYRQKQISEGSVYKVDLSSLSNMNN